MAEFFLFQCFIGKKRFWTWLIEGSVMYMKIILNSRYWGSSGCGLSLNCKKREFRSEKSVKMSIFSWMFDKNLEIFDSLKFLAPKISDKTISKSSFRLLGAAEPLNCQVAWELLTDLRDFCQNLIFSLIFFWKFGEIYDKKESIEDTQDFRGFPYDFHL